MEQVRAWLKRNKVFFETITALALSVMAIIVAVGQYYTTSRQTSFMALQTQIAEAHALPQFEIAVKQKLNVETAKFDDNYLIVDNHGGPVHGFDVEPAYFLKVSIVDQRFASGKAQIPVSGYFLSQAVSSSGTGLLTTIIGNHNNARFVDLNHQLSAAATARGWSVGLLEERVFLALTYLDLLDRRHEEYYEVPTVGGGWRLPDATGRRIFEEWRSPQRLEMSKLDPDTLLNAAETNITR